MANSAPYQASQVVVAAHGVFQVVVAAVAAEEAHGLSQVVVAADGRRFRG